MDVTYLTPAHIVGNAFSGELAGILTSGLATVHHALPSVYVFNTPAEFEKAKDRGYGQYYVQTPANAQYAHVLARDCYTTDVHELEAVQDLNDAQVASDLESTFAGLDKFIRLVVNFEFVGVDTDGSYTTSV